MNEFDKKEAERIYNLIKNGELDFEEFWYDWIDNLKNFEFGSGVEFERKRCIKVVKTSYVIDEGDDIIEQIVSRIDDDSYYEQGFQ